MVSRSKQNHKKKGFLEVFNIDENYLKLLYEKQNGKCYWSEMVLSINNVGLGELDTISIDRLDCTVGYIQGNIVLCSKFMNLGRGNYPADKFKEFLKTILNK